MLFKESFYIKLKEERQKRKWTQKEVSEKIGISRSYYSDIENGRTLPSSKILFKINSILPIFLAINDADRIQSRWGAEKNDLR
ncbi:helix-turn-helix transcriptional regulator [Virgibacillus sp.]|uniref:helix-turn-helix domain-containing protein n=1 Tax=Virgibacillus sp. TaxID=1872700 RepID=UPI00185A61A0|nr:helix-turn-helix transcriptional regulator [Virgibacillus sp.]NWO14667.1 helix-turn-helix transcriptional regulator [Virgibacillus sp.]